MLTASPMTRSSLQNASCSHSGFSRHSRALVDAARTLTAHSVLSHREATVKEHQLIQRNVGHGQTILDDRISKVQHDLTVGFQGVDARLVGMAADLAEAANGSNPLTTSMLITASNKPTANSTAMGTAINDAYVRIREIAGSISLCATVAQLGTTFQAMLRQLSASTSTGTAPPAMSGDYAALINTVRNPMGSAPTRRTTPTPRHRSRPPGFVRPSPSWSRLRCSGVRACRRRRAHRVRPAHPSVGPRLCRCSPGLHFTCLRRTHLAWYAPSSPPVGNWR
ncbi:hypothetical protein C8R44DRAFT_225501 [Mycena epipterygia]|nr:hypothetical protein C8R44DRAFT_225501 [Mycena epipterygia]